MQDVPEEYQTENIDGFEFRAVTREQYDQAEADDPVI